MSETTLRSDNHKISEEIRRQHHHAELARQKNEETTARRLVGDGSGAGDSCSSSKTSADLVAYKNVNDFPPPGDLMIQIDQKNEAVLLPINGSMVPFHVDTIRIVSSQQDSDRTCYVRIIFNVPGTSFSQHDSTSLKNPDSIYLKEVSFRSKDPMHIREVVQLMKTLRIQVVSRESERVERATLVTQEKLRLAGNRSKPIRLLELWIRPPFDEHGRKLAGTLEAHLNGFRYGTSRTEVQVDIMFANIKHAFFQPAEKEKITLLHFHLHNHIMVGNNETKDVQFYVEVMDVVQTVDFQSFVNCVKDLWVQPQFNVLDLEFEQPLRELGFHGVPYISSAFIVPTSTCLVELIETPFLVVTLGEIEIVNLERVGLEQKNFDMAIVFKEFKRDVLRIDCIPSTDLNSVKEWLGTTDIKYYESRLNLNWRQILMTIIDDRQSFIDDGGWEFLNLEYSDSDSDQSEESDQWYESLDAEPEYDSEADEYDSEEVEYDSEEVEYDSEEDEYDSEEVEYDSEEDEYDSESLVEFEDEEEDSEVDSEVDSEEEKGKTVEFENEEEDSEVDSDEEKVKTSEELEREASKNERKRRRMKGDDSDSEEE